MRKIITSVLIGVILLFPIITYNNQIIHAVSAEPANIPLTTNNVATGSASIEMSIVDNNGNLVEKFAIPLYTDNQNILHSSGNDFCISHNNGDWVECHFSAGTINAAINVSGVISATIFGFYGKAILSFACAILGAGGHVNNGIWANYDIYETEVYYDMYDHYTTYKYKLSTWGWQ
jgi:hypothetical protein